MASKSFHRCILRDRGDRESMTRRLGLLKDLNPIMTSPAVAVYKTYP